ncbi:aminoacyl-tRNA hydrolase [Pontiella sulfatireligans]|uniref:aminoacyl-tRNA hydrolase n=1 Tax=Pontiella sulfatireligans TaxID=2750658 RepID=UPI0014439F10|nr:aminoacyl-tRNA hydrolase [Pontiella sulfatireligans]
MKLVVGLGNPGKEYERTRHNVGFLVVEEIARRQGAVFKKMFWFPARQAKCRIGEHEVRLLEPMTYMNRSGQAVWGAMKKWRVEAGETVVVYDDVELELGAIRVRGKGTGGSHNGMKSVLEWLQTKAFPRVRVGIGPKPEGADMIGFVLGSFADEESLRLEKVVERAADAVESIFSIGTERTMNTFNQSKTG